MPAIPALGGSRRGHDLHSRNGRRLPLGSAPLGGAAVLPDKLSLGVEAAVGIVPPLHMARFMRPSSSGHRRWPGSFVDGRREGVHGGMRGRSPPLTLLGGVREAAGVAVPAAPLSKEGAALGRASARVSARGQGPIHPSRQRSGRHHVKGAWASGSLKSALLQGLGESDTATQHNGKRDATKAAEPDLPALLMDLPVDPRRPLVKVTRHLEAGGWTHGCAVSLSPSVAASCPSLLAREGKE